MLNRKKCYLCEHLNWRGNRPYCKESNTPCLVDAHEVEMNYEIAHEEGTAIEMPTPYAHDNCPKK